MDLNRHSCQMPGGTVIYVRFNGDNDNPFELGVLNF